MWTADSKEYVVQAAGAAAITSKCCCCRFISYPAEAEEYVVSVERMEDGDAHEAFLVVSDTLLLLLLLPPPQLFCRH
jgi:hypothetical protein